MYELSCNNKHTRGSNRQITPHGDNLTKQLRHSSGLARPRRWTSRSMWTLFLTYSPPSSSMKWALVSSRKLQTPPHLPIHPPPPPSPSQLQLQLLLPLLFALFSTSFAFVLLLPSLVPCILYPSRHFCMSSKGLATSRDRKLLSILQASQAFSNLKETTKLGAH